MAGALRYEDFKPLVVAVFDHSVGGEGKVLFHSEEIEQAEQLIRRSWRGGEGPV